MQPEQARTYRWLQVNGATEQANQIRADSVQTTKAFIRYQAEHVAGERDFTVHRRRIPHTIRYEDIP